jgi:hypothetical protein
MTLNNSLSDKERDIPQISSHLMLSKAGIRMSKELPNLSSEEIKQNVSKRESI